MFEIINTVLSTVFAPILMFPPMIAEAIITAFMMFTSSMFSKYLVDQEAVRTIKNEIKSLQTKAKELQKTAPQEANKLFSEILKLNNKYMKLNLKPMIATMTLVILFFPWLSSVFLGKVVFTIFGFTFGWLLWYIILSLVFSMIFRKLLGVQ